MKVGSEAIKSFLWLWRPKVGRDVIWCIWWERWVFQKLRNGISLSFWIFDMFWPNSTYSTYSPRFTLISDLFLHSKTNKITRANSNRELFFVAKPFYFMQIDQQQRSFTTYASRDREVRREIHLIRWKAAQTLIAMWVPLCSFLSCYVIVFTFWMFLMPFAV